jgi:ribonucleoside-triphosphate reductase
MAKTVVKYLDEYVIPVTIEKELGDLLNSMDKELLEIEGLTREFLDIIKRHDDYSNEKLDTYSIEGNSSALGQKNYMSRDAESKKALDKLINYRMLWKMLKDLFGVEKANEVIKESIEGTFMIHDMTNNGIDCLYCTTLSAKNIAMYGRPYNDVHSKAPKYADSFMGQIVEMIIDASSRFAGAVAIPDVNVMFSWYTKREKLPENKIVQMYQRLVHLVNNPYRSGSQSPFYNMSLFTETGLYQAFGNYKYPDGSTIDDYIDEILKNQLIFAKYFGQGIEDENGIKKPVAFPVVTINIIKDAIFDDYSYITELITYFNKFDNTNIYIGSADKFASCCRLINDTSKKNAINSFGAGAIGEQITGSSRVISIDLYDIALETLSRFADNHFENFFVVLKEKMELARLALYAQRKLVENRLNEGFNVFYNIGWIKLNDYFSTYGAGGLHEATKALFGGDLHDDYTNEELEWAMKVPQFMEKFADEYSDDFMKLNVEFLTPLESGARRLGKRVDTKYNKRNTFISNQLLPLTIKVTLSRRLEIENKLGGATSAGGILHIGTEGELPIDLKMRLINKIVTQYPNVEHFAFNKTSSYCEDGHLTLANVDVCKYCKKPIIEKILRVIGYYKPVKNWSAPRKQEFPKRDFHSLKSQVEFIQKDDESDSKSNKN